MDKARKVIVALILIVGLGLLAYYLFKDEILQLKNNDPSIGAIERDLKVVEQEFFSDKPLRFDSQSQNAFLSLTGVVENTNRERLAANLTALTISEKLNQSAKLKLDDMFANQYFEHQAPNGDGPSDLAKKVNYAFVMVGENLALGNFADDKALVDGWMASPGHKENILRPQYTEIGVAVGQGIFEGKKTWLAVQEFGTPSSACPSPSEALTKEVDDGKLELARQEIEIDQKKRQLDAYEPKRGQEYEAIVRDYNNLIEIYNQLVQKVRFAVEQYNLEADSYNTCLKKYSN